ncbi:pilus assembly FimT family protein [Desulfonema magnum]|uniref:Prepilin-type cleavage/methylation domain-containing protein n=1 Tax=Desulfonema magnum TaxID=45655 RepID=A0A975BUK3_9BACT|nr:prepilin-type N-terminal cleavage/methylation domain-containing protein [Desulfonema magnum]QTA92014.1 Prepilin-type cleavage/methylation domain-containing protein [Desulfonema magnum]
MNIYLRNNNGFTIIEMMAVVMLIGIVSAFAFSSMWFPPNPIISKIDTIKNHLRYAQLRALSDDVYLWRISFSSSPSDSYTLSKISEAGTVIPVNLPFENSATHILGISVDPAVVTFNKWGTPVDESGSPLPADKIITLTDLTTIITIKKNTGVIP